MKLKTFMQNNAKLQKLHKKELAWVGGILLTMILVGLFCPLVFALNDDAMIKSIISGAYMGRPNGHAVYMKYPLTGFLALLYKIAGGVPWFTLFFAVCMGGCMFLVLKIVSDRLVHTKARYWGTVLAVEIMLILLIPYYLNMHYTVLAAILAGTAILCFLQESQKTGISNYQYAGMVLLWLAYMIRSQVFWMTLPFLLVAVLWKMAYGEGTFAAGIKQYAVLVGVLLLGTAISGGINWGMYHGQDWQAYESYNEARTELYDYSVILPYEEYKQVYDEIGITKEEYILITEYGTILDNEITTEKLEKLALAGSAVAKQSISFENHLKKCISDYRYRTTHVGDYPYNLILIVLYLLAFSLCICCIRRKKWKGIFLLICLGGGRSIIWLYLMVRGRYPERVTDSLYFIEIFLLMAVVLWLVSHKNANTHPENTTDNQSIKEENGVPQRKWLFLIPGIMCCLVCLIPVMTQAQRGFANAQAQMEKQEKWEQLQSYMTERPQNFYYVDVYSVVGAAAMQYEPETYENHLLLGGWMTNTPLQLQKQQETGYENPLETLIWGEDYYLVALSNRDISWIVEYAHSLGMEGSLKEVESVGEFSIYQIQE